LQHFILSAGLMTAELFMQQRSESCCKVNEARSHDLTVTILKLVCCLQFVRQCCY